MNIGCLHSLGDLIRMRIQVHYYEDEAAPTGTCAVCVVGGERLVLPDCLVFII